MLGIALALVMSLLCSCGKKAETLRVLAWIGYDEPDFISLAESRTGLRIQVKTFVGGDQMFALLQQDPVAYDVVVVDPEYVQKLITLKSIQPLPAEKFDFSDYFPTFRRFPLCYDATGRLYAVLVRFGVNGLLYNTEHITAEEASSYAVLWSEKMRGHVVLFDWYLPNMGVISRITGNRDNPYRITDEQLTSIRERLDRLRPQVLAVQSSFSEMISALASGEAWAQPTAGESLASTLRGMGKPFDWTVPREGGILWCETLAIPVGAKNPGAAVRFMQFMQGPEAQAALARRKAYIGSVPNARAYELLSEAEKDILKIHNVAEAETLLGALSVRVLPSGQSETEWQKAWIEFKAAGR
jgi:spermidine/putrescine transport system substrate-binding protein